MQNPMEESDATKERKKIDEFIDSEQKKLFLDSKKKLPPKVTELKLLTSSQKVKLKLPP